ncbi:MAG: glycosyltransferase family 4 protein [Gemmatimonadaceae bacterium]
MKLLVTVPGGERLGGAEQLLMMIMREIDSTRLEPTVCFLSPGTFGPELVQLGIAARAIDAGRLRDMRRFGRTVRWLAHVMRAESPDLILSWTQKAHLYNSPAAFLAGMTDRLVWWQHDIPRREWLNVVSTMLPTQAVGTCSEAAAAAQQRLCPRRRTFTIRAGVAPARPTSGPERAALRNELAIPPRRFVVGILARLQPWKGQHHLLRATAELRARGHDVHCLVVGGDAGSLAPAYGPSLRRLANELGLSEMVTFTGQVRDGPRYLELMDVAVNASGAEPFGIAVLEAMGLGVPVVAVDAGGPARILAGGRGGVPVPRADPIAIADAVERLIKDPDLRLRLAAAGRRTVDLDHSSEQMVRDLQDALTAVRQGRTAVGL